jgi:hypothetical protein
MTFSAAFGTPNFRHLFISARDAVEPPPKRTLNGATWGFSAVPSRLVERQVWPAWVMLVGGSTR